MAHMIKSTDNLFSVRELPWHGLGKVIEFAPDSYQALVAAGLDWQVVQKEVVIGGKVAEGYKANVRDRDDMILGIVSDRYKIVQNKDAFSFVDEIVDGKNTKYETAGSLRDGRTVWMLAQLPQKKILGDDFATYVAFINTHDGTGSVKVIATPTRIVCNNTLNYALNTAKRSWYATHAGSIQDKMQEAQDTIFRVEAYSKALEEDANDLVSKKFSDLQIAHLINELFPTTNEMTSRQKQNVHLQKEAFIKCYNQDDLANFKGTGWAIVNAASDFLTHVNITNRSPYNESRFGSILYGNNFIDQTRKLVIAA